MYFNFADHVTVLIISGSTAVGKTELSLHLAQRLNGEIISADSAQVQDIIITKYLRYVPTGLPRNGYWHC